LWLFPAGIALLVRAVTMMQTELVPSARHLIGDAAGYMAWAARIAGGEWIGNEVFYQAPLYPYVLACAQTIVGTDVTAIRAVQILWVAAGVVMLGIGSARLFGSAVGIVTSFMAATYAPAVFFDVIIQKASLGGFLLGALVCTVAHMHMRARLWGAAGLGVVLGLLVLVRENALIWVPVIGVWVALNAGRRAERVGHPPLPHGRGSDRTVAQAPDKSGLDSVGGSLGGRGSDGPTLWAAGRLGMFGLGLVVVLGPVAIRNGMLGGHWSVTTFQSGSNFYIGNHSGASGRYVPLVAGHETPEHERDDAVRLAEAAAGRTLTAREVSRYWHSRAWAEIKSDPAGWIKLLAKKIAMTVNEHEVADAESLYVYAAYSPVLGVVSSVWHFGVLAPLAAMGMWFTRRRWRELWVLYAMIASMILAVAVFYVMARYRYPVAVLLMPFAGAGVIGVGEEVRRLKVEGRKSKVKGGKAKVEDRKAKVEGRKSKVEGRKAKVEGRKAKVEGRKAKVEGRKSKVEDRKAKVDGADSRGGRAKHPLPDGRGSDRAVAQAPDKSGMYSVGGSLGGRGTDGPRARARGSEVGGSDHRRELVVGLVIGAVAAAGVNVRVFDEEKLNALSWMNMGVALAQRGEMDEARVVFGRAVEVHPTSAEANYNYGMALAMGGDFANAAEHYARAIEAMRLRGERAGRERPGVVESERPGLPGLYYNYGVALEGLGRVEEAEAAYRAAVKADPGDADAVRAVERLGGRN
jgi:4-amino-4-deoxy-L-arabinose transferase-like glycosyltransferase